EGAQPFVEQRDAFDLAVELRNERLQAARLKDPPKQPRRLRLVRRRELLESCELAVEVEDPRPVGRNGPAHQDGHPWIFGLGSFLTAATLPRATILIRLSASSPNTFDPWPRTSRSGDTKIVTSVVGRA